MPYVLTLVAAQGAGLSPGLLSSMRDATAGRASAILSPDAADISCLYRPDPQQIQAALGTAPVDVLVSRARGRRKGLLVADMDGTIAASETLDRLAELAGVGAEVAAITRASVDGETGFAQAMRDRIALLRGTPVATLERCLAEICLSSGARTLVATMRAHNARTALISSGFTVFTAHVAELCGFDEHRGNTLLIENGILTGLLQEPVLDGDAKRAALHELAASRGLRPAATMAVGDGANDLPMLREAGLAVAYRARAVVAREIHNQVQHSDFRALLYAQGYPASSFRDG